MKRARELGYQNGRQLSHYLIDVTARGRDALDAALAIAFTDVVAGTKLATHVAEIDGALLLLHDAPRSALPTRALDAPLDRTRAVDFVSAWLDAQDYGDDEHDGASRRGFHVYNERFGIVASEWNAFVAIEPCWIYLPK